MTRPRLLPHQKHAATSLIATSANIGVLGNVGLEKPKQMAQQVARAMAGSGLIRRAAGSRRLRGGGHGDVGFREWFGPGDRDPTGTLFNETPPPPGQKRKWEDWELPYYITGVLGTLILYVGFKAKPDTSLVRWAHRKAEERLREEGILVDDE